jgi:YVTN family beta-propeller protein
MTTTRLLAMASLALACAIPPAAAAPFAYVTNITSSSVSVIDIATNTVTATIPLGCATVGITVHSTGARVYVACTNGAVNVIDAATNLVTATVPTCAGPAYGLVLREASNRLYVSCSSAAQVVVLDTLTNTVAASVPVGGNTSGVAIAASGSRVYVANAGSNNVSVIDTATHTVVATVPVGSGPREIAVDPSGTRIYVTNNASASVSVVDTSTNTVSATVPVSAQPFGIAVTADGGRVLVSAWSDDTVGVIDAATLAVTSTIPLGAGTNPRGIAFAPAGTPAYIVNQQANNVSILNMATLALSTPVAVGSQPLYVAIVPPTPPTVTIDQAAAQADPALAGPINFAVVFSESVTGFDGSDISFTGSTASGTLTAVVTGGPITYNVAVSGMTSNGTVVAGIPAGAAVDSFGVASRASTSTDNSVTLSDPPPSVSIDQAAAQADPALAGPINYTVVFSEVVTGFDGADISLAGSTASGTLAVLVTGGPTTYNVAVSGMTSNGTVVASVVAGAATGSLAGASLASTSTDNTVTLSDPAPTVTIDQAPAQVDPTSVSPILFNVVFSEPVTGFDGTDISFAGSTVGGALVANVAGGGASYTVSVTGMSGNGIVVASIPAAAATGSLAGASLASTSTDNTVTFGSAPSVTINKAAGQADPANGGPIVFSVVFSSAVTGFTAGDVSFAGSTVGGTLVANVSGSGAAYTVSVTGMSGAGNVVASIPAGAATNGAFPSLASTSTDNSVAFDVTPPTVTINQAVGQADPAGTAPLVFTVAFSEPVTGFTAADVSFAGSTAAGTLAAAVSGAGPSYTVSVTGMTGTGTVVVGIPASAAADLAGNASAASTSTDNVVSFIVANASFTGPSATGTGNITASFTGGGATCSYGVARFIASPPGAPPVPPTAPPVPVFFPHGLFDFTTTGCTPGVTLAFTITYPVALPPGAQYWKYGPEAGNTTPHWYVLPATIAGNVVTFSITDGGQGDDDLAANGTIVDQGGPGVPPAVGPIQTPTLSQWGLILMALLMAVHAAGGLPRRGPSRARARASPTAARSPAPSGGRVSR